MVPTKSQSALGQKEKELVKKYMDKRKEFKEVHIVLGNFILID